MTSTLLLTSVLMAVTAGCCLSQTTTVGTQSISGKYSFLYAVWQRGESATVMGTLNFDGAGSVQVEGRWQAGPGNAREVRSQVAYRVSADGTGSIVNPLDPLLPPLSLRLGTGAGVVAASTLEASTAYQHDLLIALRAPTTAPALNALNGLWGGAHSLYATGGASPIGRAGRFRFQFDGAGAYTSSQWTFHQSDQNNGAAQETSSRGAYTIGADGSGTFESAFGRKKFALSADGNILIGTDEAAGQELICAVKATTNTATGPTGRFYWLQIVAAAPGGTDPRASQFAWALTNQLAVVNGVGLPRATTGNQFVDGPTGRLLDMSGMLGPFTVANTGYVDLGFGGLASPGIGVFSSDSHYLPWTNLTATVTGTYSFNLLVPAVTFEPGTARVWLDPVRATHHSGLSTSPAPFAPGTLMTVYGVGLAAGTTVAPSVPWPTTLGGTQLLANGQPAALYEVAPDHITFVLPSATAGAGRVDLKAVSGAGESNSIQIRTAANLPAFYSQAGNGLGPALATHADGTPISAGAPARPGEAIVFYATGLGSTTGAPAEGAAATGLSPATTPVQVDIAGAQAEVLYAGLAPGLPAVYQVNVRVPANAAAAVAANVRIFQGYTQTHPKVTIAIGN